MAILPFASPDMFLVNQDKRNRKHFADTIQVCEHSLEEKRFALRTATVEGRMASVGTLLGYEAHTFVQVPETGFHAEINFANWTCENVDGWPAWVEFEEGYPEGPTVMSSSEKAAAVRGSDLAKR